MRIQAGMDQMAEIVRRLNLILKARGLAAKRLARWNQLLCVSELEALRLI